MTQYLQQLLKETKTVIIPGFGALTVTNETTGEIMFMPYLKFDDGTLTKFIIEQETCDLAAAKNTVSKFVNEVNIVLEKGGSFQMRNFGAFSMKDGEIVFDTENTTIENITPIVEPPVIEPVQMPIESTDVEIEAPIVAETQEPEIEETTQIEEKEAVIQFETTIQPEEPKVDTIADEPKFEATTSTLESEMKTEEQSVISNDVTPESIIEPVIVPEISKQETVIPSEEKSEITSENKIIPPVEEPKVAIKEQEKVQKAEKNASKKTGVLSYIIYGLIVLILGAGTYIAVNFNTLKKDFPILADLAGENETISTDTTALKELDVNDPDANPDGEVIAEPIPDEKVEQPSVEEEPASVAPITTPKKEEKPKPVVKPTPKPVVKPVEKPIVKPIPKPAPPTSIKPAPPKIPVSKSFPKPDLNLPFHIIAGSFSSEANAKNLGNQLRNKGMNQVSIGEQNGMYRVSIKGYASKEEASNALPSVQNAAPGSWVYNWK